MSHVDQTPADAPAVLNGWKEIAAYFRKGVRTVQRWEAEMALPVRRLSGPKGEVVYAVPSELDEWRRRHETPPNGSKRDDAPLATSSPTEDVALAASLPAAARATVIEGRPRDLNPTAGSKTGPAWLVRAGAFGLAVLAIALLAWAAWMVLRSTPVPHSVRIDRDLLVALDAAGGELWTVQLPFGPQSPGNYRLPPPAFMAGPHLVIDDLDGDGGREVLLALVGEGNEGLVACYDARGRERWRRAPDRSAQFGDQRMAAPWQPFFFEVIGNDPSASLWVSWINVPDFASFVERLDPATGRPTAVYWSAGYVTSIATGVVGGREVLFLGAANNEHRAASLAVYDLQAGSGSAPASDTRYACSDCPAARPRHFFVFPKTSVSRELLAEAGNLFVSGILQDAAGQLKVTVGHGPNGPGVPHVLYRLDPSLRLTGAETLEDYQNVRRQLEREGRLGPNSVSDDERELFPVRSWDGSRFVAITGPQG